MRIVILAMLCVATAGCGTVVRGTKQGVKFQSEPPGAAVTVVRAKKEKTQWNCTSPCEIQLSRKRDFDVTFDLAGYKPAKGRLASRLGAKGGATTIPGNFVLGGGVGFIVDAGTGANMQLKPDPMRAKLAPTGSEEESVIYNVRIEGGGVEKEHSSEDDPGADLSAAEPAPPEIRPLSPQFGAAGSTVTPASAVAGVMPDPRGVLITEVTPEGMAARAGIRVGDVVKTIDSVRVSGIEEIDRVVAAMAPGDKSMIAIWRDGALYETTIGF